MVSGLLFEMEPAVAQPQSVKLAAPVWRDLTERDTALINAMRDVSFPMGTSQKRFARNLIIMLDHAEKPQITDKQARYLTTLAWRFRRQLPATLAYPVIEGDEGIVHGFENAGHGPT